MNRSDFSGRDASILGVVPLEVMVSGLATPRLEISQVPTLTVPTCRALGLRGSQEAGLDS